MHNGNIILLNGVTSSGKSTLSKELQGAFDEPYYYVAEDTFNEIICPFITGKGKFTDPNIMHKAVSVMYRLIRDFSDMGLHVIVDHILSDGRRLNECVNVLHEYPVMFVKVECDRDELFARARKRGYTTPERLNQIDQQLKNIHKRNIYDVVISTSSNTILENVSIIKNELNNHINWNAFKRLKSIFDNEI